MSESIDQRARFPAIGGPCSRQIAIFACLKIATERHRQVYRANINGALGHHIVQSIIGATEKRRESRAGESVVTDIGDPESVRLGGGGVYQG